MSETMTVIEMPTTAFDINKAKKFVDEEQLTKLKKYIVKYFYQTSTNVFLFYEVETNKFTQYRKDDIKSVYFNKLGDYAWKWFNQNGNVYKVDTTINSPKVFKKNNQFYVNFSGTMKHKITQKYCDFNDDIKKRCEIFLAYIKEILATSEEQYNYILKWISVMCKGQKNNSALYLKSIEGSGKSTLFEFIRKHLIGQEIGIKISDTKILTGNFNILLLGALFIEFSEFPTLSKNEWELACSKIKDMITSDDMVFEAKGKDSFSAKFTASMCFVSNYDCMKESQGRRFYNVDINTHKVGDFNYWDNLYKNCFNDEIGNALFHYFYEIDTFHFDGQHSMPITNSKKDAISKRLNVVEKFLKDEYVLRRRGIEPIKVEDLHDAFLDHSGIKMDKKDFNAKMRDLGIVYFKSNDKNKYKLSIEDLNKIAQKKNWLHELDVYIEDEDDIEDKVANIFDDEAPTNIENDKLKKENEELKRLLELQKQEIENLKLLLQGADIKKEEQKEKKKKIKIIEEPVVKVIEEPVVEIIEVVVEEKPKEEEYTTEPIQFQQIQPSSDTGLIKRIPKKNKKAKPITYILESESEEDEKPKERKRRIYSDEMNNKQQNEIIKCKNNFEEKKKKNGYDSSEDGLFN